MAERATWTIEESVAALEGVGRGVVLDGMVKKQDQIPDDVLKRVRTMRRAVEAADRKAREAGR